MARSAASPLTQVRTGVSRAATGSFVNCLASTFYNASGTQLTQTAGVFCASVASTGSGSALLLSPIVQRSIPTAASTGSFVSSLSVAPGWYRSSYSVAVSSLPPAARLTAAVTLNGTALADSVSMESNLPPTSSLGTNTAVAQTGSLAGFAHFTPSATGTVGLSLLCSTGTVVVSGGSFELFAMQ